MNGKPAVCIALIAGIVYSAAESRVAEIRMPPVNAFHMDDLGPHWPHVHATDRYDRGSVGSNTRPVGPYDWS